MHGHAFARALLLGSVQVALPAGCGLGSRGGGGEMEGADLPFDPTADSLATSDDPTPHDRRHDRLAEYTRIILLVPFENYSSMCSYLVGSHEKVGATLGRYLELGFRTFLLDVPREAADLANARLAFVEAMKEAPA